MVRFAMIFIFTVVAGMSSLQSSASGTISRQWDLGLIYQASVTKFEIAPTGEPLPISGTIEVDTRAKTVTFSIDRQFNCPAKTLCAQVMPSRVVITLPLSAVETDSCGARIIKAKREKGNHLQEIEIRDNTKNTCKEFAGSADTEIVYSLRNTEKSTDLVWKLEASRLEQL